MTCHLPSGKLEKPVEQYGHSLQGWIIWEVGVLLPVQHVKFRYEIVSNISSGVYSPENLGSILEGKKYGFKPKED